MGNDSPHLSPNLHFNLQIKMPKRKLRSETRLLNTLQDKYRDIFLSFHQNVWCWTDEWFGMTMDDIRRLEADTKRELEDRINDAQKRGNTKID